MTDLTHADIRAATYTVLGEAAGEGSDGMAAVAWTIKNRLAAGKFGDTVADVAKAVNAKGVHQYSTWNTKSLGGNQPTRRYTPSSPTYKKAENIVLSVMAGGIADPTGGSKFYIVKSLAHPSWFDAVADGGTKIIGNHLFAQSRMDVASNDALLAIAAAAAPVPMLKPTSIYASQLRDAAIAANPMPGDLVRADINALALASGRFPDPTMNKLTDALSVFASKKAAALGAPPAVQALAADNPSGIRVIEVNPDGSPTSLVSRKVQTLRIDPMTNTVITGKPTVAYEPPRIGAPVTLAETRAEQAAARGVKVSGAIKTVGLAGNVQLPAGVVPKSVLADQNAIRAQEIATAAKKAIGPQYGPAKNSSGSPDDRSSPESLIPHASGTINPTKDQIKLVNPLPATPKPLQNGTKAASPITARIADMVATVPGYSVPKYIDIVKQVQVSASQPIAKGDGVHWDQNAGMYVINDDAPAGPKTITKTITSRELNPKYDAEAARAAADAKASALKQQSIARQNALSQQAAAAKLQQQTALAGMRANQQANAARVANGQRPITYGPPVAAGNFAEGSPNASFEKEHGMGSVTNSMASSSRWNTGY